jgi:PhzF family phenazine biosynthesis protein
MKIKIYQVDAFTDHLFGGNPAAVCPLPYWPAGDTLLQNIAMENNLSETAFLVKNKDHYEIRWFTPKVEIDLCGHATLASAHVIFHHLEAGQSLVEFESRKYGRLKVVQNGNLLTLDFPALIAHPIKPPVNLDKTFGIRPSAVLEARDLLIVFNTEDEIRALKPDLALLKKLNPHAVIVTAPGKTVDFVSRFFAPNVGIEEDPVTGSAHTTLVPYWSERLKKNKLHALQLSSRKGELFCEYKDNRVFLAGKAVTFMLGILELPNQAFNE